MAGDSICRSCGSRLTHLRGATGNVSTCPRCGWGRLELTRDEKIVTPGMGLVRCFVARQQKAVGRP
jgi:predicted RNA-binding Zn-ribbon protein involved in translation (DUF1610 family)